MNRDQQINRIKELISSYRSGTISSPELNELYNILNDSDEHLEQYLNKEWQFTSRNNASFDTTQHFEKLKQRIGIQDEGIGEEMPLTDTKRTRFMSYAIIKYATILVMGLLAGYLVHNQVILQNHQQTVSNISTISVDKGSKSTVLLPDDSKVHLNSDSKISYEVDFGKNNRVVDLVGEGFFEVTHNPAKPFYVNTEQITVKVLGTSFNVRSYINEDITETSLVSGSIEVLSNRGRSNSEKTGKEAGNSQVITQSKIQNIHKRG